MRNKRLIRWLAPLGAVLLVGTLMLAGAHEDGEREERRVFSSNVVVFNGQGWLGVQVSDVTPEKVSELGLPGEYGAIIEEVEEESPAAAAGLQENDVILEFAGERVRSVAHLRRLVRETPSGRRVSLQVSRGGSTRTLEAKLESRRTRFRIPEIRVPEIEIPRIEVPDFDVHVFSTGPRLGISGEELTSQLAEYFGVKDGKGVLVREVLVGSAAAKGGVKAGDVVVRVNGEAVSTVGALRRVLRRQREGNEVTLTIVRERREQTLKVQLEKRRRSAPRRIADFYRFEAPESWKDQLEAELESSAWRKKMQKLKQELKRLQQRVRESVQNL